MKTKFKILSAIALCSVMASAIAFAACGDKPEEEGPDTGTTTGVTVAGKTWTELSSTTYDDWDAKTIKYQYSTEFKLYESYTLTSGMGIDTTVDTEGDLGASIYVLMNLYEDGTALFLQADAYDVAGATYWNSADHITTVMFGVWSGGEDGSGAMGQGRALKIYFGSEKAPSEKITASDSWAEDTDGCYNTEINGKEGNGSFIFTYQASTRRYLPVFPQITGKTELMFLATNFSGVEDQVTYNKISDWVSSYSSSSYETKETTTINFESVSVEPEGGAGGEGGFGGPGGEGAGPAQG